MDRLSYTSLSALRGAMARQTATANNLANVNTVGFRGEMASARALWVRGETYEARAFSSNEVTGADLRPGTINQTGRELDVAIDGSAFFTVRAMSSALSTSIRSTPVGVARCTGPLTSVTRAPSAAAAAAMAKPCFPLERLAM